MERVFDFLQQQGIEYSFYTHPEAPTIEIARQYWHNDGSKHCKNLFFRNHKGNRHYLVVFDSEQSLAIHDLEQRLKQGKLSFASEQRMDIKQAKALVLACNTATALAAEELRALYPQKPIIGMEPALKPAVCIGHAPRVLLLATATTLREEKFAALLKKYEKSATVTALSAPLLVEYAEQGACQHPALRSYLSTLLAKQKETPPDALVLGCTHFFFAKELILETLGVDIPVFDGIRATAAQLARRLDQQDLRNPTPQRGAVTFTSSKERILPLYAKLFFGE